MAAQASGPEDPGFDPDRADGVPATGADPHSLTVDFEPFVEDTDPKTSADLTLDDRTEPVRPDSKSSFAVRDAVPGYEIVRELGRGGMGVVYHARQKGLNRPVALKMILSGDHAGEGERDRFRREAEAVAALQHPNIVQIFEIGEADGRPYLAFEFVEGGTLAAHLGGNPWPSRSAAALVEVLARAVQFAHDRGIVHRDLKPGNILLTAEGGRGKAEKDESAFRPPPSPLPKITDFGLAKRVEKDSDWTATSEMDGSPQNGQTRTGAVMGTPSYIAPEQAAGKNRDVGTAADVYSLGAILYELLTGRPPFKGETPLDTVLQVMHDDPVPPRNLQSKVPRDLETICLKCLRKLPAARYGSAGELADDLRRFLNHEPIYARPIGSRERLAKWTRRHPALAMSGFITALAMVATLAISFYFNYKLKLEAAKSREAQVAAERYARDLEEQTRYANEQKRKADERLKEGDKARRESLQRADQAQRTTYALALNRAMALVERDPYRASLLLDKREECPVHFRDFTWNYLQAMCRVVDSRFLTGHAEPITRIVWSADGSRLATASWDKTVRVWDAKSHKPLAILKGHHGIVRSVAFAGDRRTLVTIDSDREVKFWELPASLSGNKAVEITPWASVEADELQTLAVSPDGLHVAAGGIDGRIHLFDLPPLPRAGLMAIGGSLASLASRKPEGGAAPSQPSLPFPFQVGHHDLLVGHRDLVTALVWNRNGLFSASHDRTVRRWKPGEKLDGEVVYQSADRVLAIDVAADQDLLAVAVDAATDASVKVVSLRIEGKETRLRGHTRNVNSLAFSGDGKQIASASDDGTVRLWETANGQEVSVYRGHKGKVLTVAFSPDQLVLASGGLDVTVRFWRLTAPREQTDEMAVRTPIPVAAMTPDGKYVAVAERDGTVKVWVRTGDDVPREPAFVLRAPVPKEQTALAIEPTGKWVAAAYRDDPQVVVWPLPRGKGKAPKDTAPRFFKAAGEVNDVRLHGDFLAVAGKGGVQVWDVHAKALFRHPLRTAAISVAFTPDGRQLIAAGDRPLHVFDLASGQEVCHLPFTHVNREVSHVAVGPSKEENYANPEPPEWAVVTCDRSGGAAIWRLKEGTPGDGRMELEHLALLTGHAEPINAVAFTKYGKTIATASEDRTVRLWDPVTGRERAALTTHTDAVLTASFFPDDWALMSLSRDGALKTWRAPRPVEPQDARPDGPVGRGNR